MRFGKSRSKNPSHAFSDLKPCESDGQAHEVLGPTTGEHGHVTTRLQHAQALGPHCGRWDKRVPILAHEAATLRGNCLRVSGNPRGENVRNLRGFRITQSIRRICYD